MFEGQKIAFIGPGVMAEAMISGLIHRGVVEPEMMTAAGPTVERLTHLAGKYSILTTIDNSSAACQADIVVLSLKPQRLEKVMAVTREDIQEVARDILKPGKLNLAIVGPFKEDNREIKEILNSW